MIIKNTELQNQINFLDKAELKEQLKFIKSNEKNKFSAGVMMESFLRGIRDLGYKSVSYAINELIDNSIQAGASKIAVMTPAVGNYITDVIIADNGHGMHPDMLPFAVSWGGTHRQGNRKGFGKYGYGLPSSTVSMGKVYTVYSKLADNSEWSSITVNLNSALANNNEHFDPNAVFGTVESIEKLPIDMLDELNKNGFDAKQLISGTIIHVQEIDKIKNLKPTLEQEMIEDFGASYYDFFPNVSISVNDKAVEGIDPLFATPGLKYYHSKENGVSSSGEHYSVQKLPIKHIDTSGKEIDTESVITIRMNQLPADWATENGKLAASTDKKTELGRRFAFLKNNNGVVFKRLGRRIDVSTKNPLSTFGNNTRYTRIEIDFPPSLDEHFEMNTSKQQVIPTAKFWQKIIDKSNPKVKEALGSFSRQYQEDMNAIRFKVNTTKAKLVAESGKTHDEVLMEESILRGGPTATLENIEREKRAAIKRDEKIASLAKTRGVNVEQAAQAYELEYASHKYKKTEQKMGTRGPVFRTEEHGGTVEVILNSDHQWFKKVYQNSSLSNAQRLAWTTYFFAIGEKIAQYPEDDQDFLLNFFMKVSDRYTEALRKKNMDDPDLPIEDPLDDVLDALKPTETTVN